MRNRVHPVLIVLTLVIVLVTVAIVYSRRLPTPAAEPDRPMTRSGPMRGTPDVDTELGIQWIPWFAPLGIRIMNFLPGDLPSPLWLIGCQQGDILVSVNDSPIEGSDLHDALAELRENGTPFTLGLIRMGRDISKEIESYPEFPPALAHPAEAEGSSVQPSPTSPAEPQEYLGGIAPNRPVQPPQSH